MQLHKLIKHYRKTKKITQTDIAKRLDVTQAYISAVESGDAHASVSQLKKVIEGLGGTLLIQLENQGLTPQARLFIETAPNTPSEMIKIAKAFNTNIIFKIK
jgi:predicted transcriptional regulator